MGKEHGDGRKIVTKGRKRWKEDSEGRKIVTQRKEETERPREVKGNESREGPDILGLSPPWSMFL